MKIVIVNEIKDSPYPNSEYDLRLENCILYPKSQKWNSLSKNNRRNIIKENIISSILDGVRVSCKSSGCVRYYSSSASMQKFIDSNDFKRKYECSDSSL